MEKSLGAWEQDISVVFIISQLTLLEAMLSSCCQGVMWGWGHPLTLRVISFSASKNFTPPPT